jgi:hypothetical protein
MARTFSPPPSNKMEAALQPLSPTAAAIELSACLLVCTRRRSLPPAASGVCQWRVPVMVVRAILHVEICCSRAHDSAAECRGMSAPALYRCSVRRGMISAAVARAK